MARGRATWVAVCALAALAAAATADEGNKGKEDGKDRGAPGTIPVAGVREPSGIAWHPGLGRFFVVGDDGTLAELDAEGRLVGQAIRVGGNLEDVTVHGPSGLLVLLSEAAGELIVWDPKARREMGRATLDSAALLGRRPAEPRQGFEGLYFLAGGAHEGGGLFYLAHQRAPAAVLAVEFDPTSPAATIGADAVALRWPDIGADDLTAITAVPGGRIAVISEVADRILLFDAAGAPMGEAALPGLQQEGLCVDGRGEVWIADDRAGGVLRLGDAKTVLVAPPSGKRKGGGR